MAAVHHLRRPPCTTGNGTNAPSSAERVHHGAGIIAPWPAECLHHQAGVRTFPREEELQTKSVRLDELNILLNLDKKENEIVDGDRADDDEDRPKPDRGAR